MSEQEYFNDILAKAIADFDAAHNYRPLIKELRYRADILGICGMNDSVITKLLIRAADAIEDLQGFYDRETRR